MLDYLQTMFDLALRKELQGLHFWATVYVLVVLLGTVWHVLRVRRWPSTQGQLLRLGVRKFAGPALNPADQAYVPDALYAYEVAGRAYQGRELSVWKVSASGILRGAAGLLPARVKADAAGRVPVYYHPKRPHKSLLLRPGVATVVSVWLLMALVAGFYLWRWWPSI